MRYIACLGIAIFAVSCFMNTTLSFDSAGDQFFLPNIVRAIGQALVITPVSARHHGRHLAERRRRGRRGLSNMMRNLGGAVGTATLGTILTKREQFHSNIIGQSITLTRDEVRSRLDQMTAYFLAHGVSDHAAATAKALVALGAAVRRQALIMAFSDAFAVIGVLLAIARRLHAPRPQAPGRCGSGRPH